MTEAEGEGEGRGGGRGDDTGSRRGKEVGVTSHLRSEAGSGLGGVRNANIRPVEL